jgi:hypothetical protein
MSFSSHARSSSRRHFRGRVFILFSFTAFALAAISACGTSSSSVTSVGGVGPSGCPVATTDGGLLPFEVAGDGTVQGTGLDVTFCAVGVSVNSEQAPSRLGLDSTTLATSSTVTLPAGGVSGNLSGFVDLSTLTSSPSTSSDPTLCGGLVFSYGVPAVPASACVLDASFGNFTCPTGCTFANICPVTSANDNGCCVPLATTYIYQATTGAEDASSNGCSLNGAESLGSWTVTLESATPEDAGYYGTGYYAPHGTLTATLVGTTGKTDTVNLSLKF